MEVDLALTAKEYLRRNLNVPNVLSFIRLLLVPVYAVLFVKGLKYQALAVFVAASVTDLFDGYIARKYNLITDLGKLLDPFADKVMVLTAMFSMTIGNAFIPGVLPWCAVIILLFKELVMIIGGLVMLKLGIVVYSNIVGKTAHFMFIVALILSYFHDFMPVLFGGIKLDIALLWLSVALTLCALVNYIVFAVGRIKEKRAADAE